MSRSPPFDRRAVLALLAGTVMSMPAIVRAQQNQAVPLLAYLSSSRNPFGQRFDVFADALAKHGWVEGRTIRFERRNAAGDADRTRLYAAELVRLMPNVMLARNSVSVEALHKETRTIPIVFVNVPDPIGSKFVTSLARPGANITGFTNYDYGMGRKWLELLNQVAPGLTRVAVMLNPDNPGGAGLLRDVQKTAPSFAMRVVPIDTRVSEVLERATAEFAGEPRGGMLVTPSAGNGIDPAPLIALAARHRLPAVYPYRYYESGLISYGVDQAENWHAAADYVDRILRGEKPGDLPIQNPTKFELVINLKTAKALGLIIPPSLLARADEVIE
jgi:putative ABC transport system substrate-binding protein